VPTDGHTDTLTDANQFYILSHAICYRWWFGIAVSCGLDQRSWGLENGHPEKENSYYCVKTCKVLCMMDIAVYRHTSCSARAIRRTLAPLTASCLTVRSRGRWLSPFSSLLKFWMHSTGGTEMQSIVLSLLPVFVWVNVQEACSFINFF